MKRKQPESKLRERVSEDLKALRLETRGRVYHRKIVSALVGTPDYLICVAGRFGALELKRDESVKLEPMQEHNFKRIKKAGGFCFKVTPVNWPKVLSAIKSLCAASFKNT